MADGQPEKKLVDKELNVDFWWYQSHEYHRGDLVQIDPENKHHQQLTALGAFVDPGFAEALAQSEAEAQAAAAEREVELAAIADEEAHRKVAAEEAKATGVLPSSGDEGESDEGKHASGSERTYIVPNKGATRRRS